MNRIHSYIHINRQCHGRNYRCCIRSCSIERDDDDIKKERTTTIRRASEQANKRVRLSLVNLGLFSHCLYVCVCVCAHRRCCSNFYPVLANEHVKEREKREGESFLPSLCFICCTMCHSSMRICMLALLYMSPS